MSTIGTVVMVAGGIGALVGMRQAKAGATWGQPMAIGCALVTLALALMGIVSSSGSAKGMMNAITQYNHASGEVLGRHLAEKFEGKRALVLLQPASELEAADTFNNSILDGLRRGLGSSLEIVNTINLTPPPALVGQMDAMSAGLEPGGEDEAYMDYELMNYEMWFDSKYLSDFLAEHKGTFDVLISAVGMPMDLADSPLSRETDLPEIAVLNASGYGMKNLVTEGVLDAVVTYNPDPEGWKDMKSVPKNTADAFAKRYLLVTPDNIDEMSATYPNAFN